MALSIAADRETAERLLVPSFDGEECTATDAAGAATVDKAALLIAADHETAKRLLVPSFDGEERTATDAAGAEAASRARA